MKLSPEAEAEIERLSIRHFNASLVDKVTFEEELRAAMVWAYSDAASRIEHRHDGLLLACVDTEDYYRGRHAMWQAIVEQLQTIAKGGE